ncbi:MAG: hypothetical protein UW32_C0001G0063 [Candidatus Wolfebacteria bacterium GW2011_GWE2_44_13]|uniref:Uncharacterized protein n=1 Tax=Candidatus Wolfebacteria bacterium GW2011_GWE2_44_13 TaxID=1619017 RepID=A0A0G1H7V4_9BACT|nr:MAG: hypothetical protein UW32_C0001G0063 [Candidatus Wolfebacteria bacterium GW2011_GWE2_44_13]
MRQRWVWIAVKAFLFKLVLAELFVIIAAFVSTWAVLLIIACMPAQINVPYGILYFELWLVLTVCAPFSIGYALWDKVLLIKRLAQDWDVPREDVAYAICTKSLHKEEGFDEWDRGTFLQCLQNERDRDKRRKKC